MFHNASQLRDGGDLQRGRPTASHETVLKALTSYLKGRTSYLVIGGATQSPEGQRRHEDISGRTTRSPTRKLTNGAWRISNRPLPQLTKFLRQWTTQNNQRVWLLVNVCGEHRVGPTVSRLFRECSIDVMGSFYVRHVLAATPPDRLATSIPSHPVAAVLLLRTKNSA